MRPHLRGILERDKQPLGRGAKGPILYLNAALTQDLKTLDRLRELTAAGQPFIAVADQR